ncbi:MAG: hypothetical protein GYB68_02520 [Chloroflexi bacterium]|nr:hypothetical protein [Chloroflexota bacterium]
MSLRSSHFVPFVVLVGLLALAGCAIFAPPTASPVTLAPTPTGSLPTVTPFQPTEPPPTEPPTEVPRDYITFNHPTEVFNINIPLDWESIDESSDQRLLVRFIPPQGFASRVAIEVTNEGNLPADEVEILADSYLRLRYANNPNYSQVSRTTLEDGRIQVVFLYDDGRGGAGRETLYMEQIGQYFTALRLFLADKDASQLSLALDAVLSTFTINELANWGSQVAAINPAELLLVNTFLWRDNQGVTNYTGELYNTSPAPITEAQVRVAVCDVNGIILTEISTSVVLQRIERGAVAPFNIAVSDLPEGVEVCSERVSAQPAQPDATYTRSLNVDSFADLDNRNVLFVEGTIANPGLAPITEIELLVIVYNADGLAIGYQLVEFGGELILGPGESTGYRVEFEAGIGGEPVQFAALVQGIQLQGLAVTPTPDATPTPEVPLTPTP